MRAFLSLLAVMLVLSSSGCVLEAQAVSNPLALPQVANWPALPVAPAETQAGLSLQLAPTQALSLPGLHERVDESAHATAKHGTDAARARRIIEDGRSKCSFYNCSGRSGTNVLRACQATDGRTTAFQFLWPDMLGAWHEGTAFITTDAGKAARLVEGHQCQLITSDRIVAQPYPAFELWLYVMGDEMEGRTW